MCSDAVVISARGLGKTFRIFDHPGDRLRQAATFGLRHYHRTFTALADVSFDVHRGETMGVIGINGSGKSTLLQLVCGILRPSAGSVTVDGRVSALLELGAGFSREFTGRENVLFQGALLGIGRREMERRFEDIAAFADIGEFIDQPVWTYSSGMFVRLAFAVAVHVDPQILVVDEALAVGDTAFQAKGFRRIQEMRDRGASILFVTHATDQVLRLCDRALLLDHGRVAAIGEPREVVNTHLVNMFRGGGAETPAAAGGDDFATRPGYNAHESRYGSRAGEIVDFRFEPARESGAAPRFAAHDRITLVVRVVFHEDVDDVTFAVAVGTLDGTVLFGVNSREFHATGQRDDFRAGDVVEARYTLSLDLARGEYLLSLSLAKQVGGDLAPLDRRHDSITITVENPLTQRGMVDLRPAFEFSRDTGTSAHA